MKMCMIGCRGHWGYVFADIKSVPDVEICAIASGCNSPIEPLQKTCEEFGFSPKVYENYIEMLDNEKPDIVTVDGPFEEHAKMSIEALNRNIHVFCEKPVAITLEDFELLEDSYYNSNAKIFSMIGLRYEANFQTALELVKSGAIGKVKIISTRKSYRLGSRPDFYKSRNSYGGTIPWVGSHALDWIMSFSNSSFAKIFAMQSAEDNFDHGELEIAAECQFKMANGVLAQASIDYLRPAAAPSHGDDRVRVAGTTGVIEVANGEITLIDANGERKVPAEVKRNLFSDIILDIQGKRPAITTPAETLALTKACLLAQKSADTGELISIAYQ